MTESEQPREGEDAGGEPGDAVGVGPRGGLSSEPSESGEHPPIAEAGQGDARQAAGEAGFGQGGGFANEPSQGEESGVGQGGGLAEESGAGEEPSSQDPSDFTNYPEGGE
jgi:hypothetical protein